MLIILMNKNALSSVVATVLIIWITIAAVAILWMSILPMIRDKLSLGVDCLNADVFVGRDYTCYDAGKKIVGIQVVRGSGDVNVSGLQFLVDNLGDTASFISHVGLGGYNSQRMFYIPVNEGAEDISIAPIVRAGLMEKVCGTVSKVKLHFCNLSSTVNLNLVTSESLMNSNSWKIGVGNEDGFLTFGSPSANSRVAGVGPYGNKVLLWKVVSSPAGFLDGGWYSSAIKIDPTKTYRSTIWIKKVGSSGGTTYFGCSGVNNLDGTINNNPYFWTGNLPNLNRWYLLVGYIHGSEDGSMVSYGGVYDGATGKRIYFTTDFKNKVGSNLQIHRSYLAHDGNSSDIEYFWNPTFSEVSDSRLPLEIQ